MLGSCRLNHDFRHSHFLEVKGDQNTEVDFFAQADNRTVDFVHTQGSQRLQIGCVGLDCLRCESLQRLDLFRSSVNDDHDMTSLGERLSHGRAKSPGADHSESSHFVVPVAKPRHPIMTFFSAYLYFTRVTPRPAAAATVKIPTRPTNITRIKINFPRSLRCGVMPVLRPQLAKAETTSKNISMNCLELSV